MKKLSSSELKSTLQTKIIGCMSPEQQSAQSDLWSNSAGWIITGLFLLLMRKHTTENSCSPGLSSHVILTRRLKAVKPSTSCYNTHTHSDTVGIAGVCLYTFVPVCECVNACSTLDERDASQNKSFCGEPLSAGAKKFRLILVSAREAMRAGRRVPALLSDESLQSNKQRREWESSWRKN